MSRFLREGLQGETFPVQAVRMELNHCHFPDDASHTSGLLGKDAAVMKLVAMHDLMYRWDSFVLVSMELPLCPMQTLPHSRGMLQTPGVLTPKSPLTGGRKLEIFLQF